MSPVTMSSMLQIAQGSINAGRRCSEYLSCQSSNSIRGEQTAELHLYSRTSILPSYHEIQVVGNVQFVTGYEFIKVKELESTVPTVLNTEKIDHVCSNDTVNCGKNSNTSTRWQLLCLDIITKQAHGKSPLAPKENPGRLEIEIM